VNKTLRMPTIATIAVAAALSSCGPHGPEQGGPRDLGAVQTTDQRHELPDFYTAPCPTAPACYDIGAPPCPSGPCRDLGANH